MDLYTQETDTDRQRQTWRQIDEETDERTEGERERIKLKANKRISNREDKLIGRQEQTDKKRDRWRRVKGKKQRVTTE